MPWKKFDGDILLTTACPVECDFCIYGCNPEGEWMPEDTIRRVAKEYTQNDVGIRICGGEPFLDLGKLEQCLDIVLEYQKPEEVLVITSGFFANTLANARKSLNLLKKRKFDTLVVSTDRWHLAKVPLEYIENIISEAGDIKIIIRLTTDEQSYSLMDQVAGLVVKHSLKIEPHHCYGVYGKAELLDIADRDNHEQREKYLKERIESLSGRPMNQYVEQSPKRSQRKFASRWYPTTFPNGNVYADTQCCKGSFMGNINEESLESMNERFSKTLPGSILWSESNCDREMPKFIPSGADNCDYCRNWPFVQEMPKESIGRQMLIIESEDDMMVPLNDRELLLSFRLKEGQLNREYGRKILAFLEKLKGRRLVFSRPLPRCLFGAEYSAVVGKYNMPTGCYGCRELFSVDSARLVGCEHVQVASMVLGDRNQIFDLVNTSRLQNVPCNTCLNCKYHIRKQCDGSCFRNLSTQKKFRIKFVNPPINDDSLGPVECHPVHSVIPIAAKVRSCNHHLDIIDYNTDNQYRRRHGKNIDLSALYCDGINDFIDEKKDVPEVRNTIGKLLEMTDFAGYDLVCFSIVFRDQLAPALAISRVLKEKFNPKIILGGSYLTILSNLGKDTSLIEKLLHKHVDNIIIGDGQEPILQYLDYMMGKKSINDVAGAVHIANGKYLINKPSKLDLSQEDIDIRGLPWGQYLELSPKKTVLYRINSGCSYGKCTYCVGKIINDVQLKDPQIIRRDIVYLKKSGFKRVFFTDNELCIDEGHIRKVCKIMSELNMVWTGLTRVPNVTEDRARMYRKSYCDKIFVGVESFSNRILRLLNKGYTANQALNAIRILTRNGINVSIPLLVGYPGENREDVLESIKVMQANKELLGLVHINVFELYVGSDIYNSRKNISDIQIELEDYRNFGLARYSENRLDWQQTEAKKEMLANCYREFIKTID